MARFIGVFAVVRVLAGEGRYKLTPEMQAGVTNELWTMQGLYEEVMA
jgi:hypothetical protein